MSQDGKRVTRDHAGQRTDAELELVDLLDYQLPLLDERCPSGATSRSPECEVPRPNQYRSIEVPLLGPGP